MEKATSTIGELRLTGRNVLRLPSKREGLFGKEAKVELRLSGVTFAWNRIPQDFLDSAASMPFNPSHYRHWTASVAVLLMVGFFAAASAQDDPFAGGEPADDTPAAAGKTPGKKKGAEKSVLDPNKAEGIAARHIIDGKPETPKQRIEAAQSLLALGFPDYARDMIGPVATSPPVGDEASQLVRQFGSAMFLNWLNHKGMAPEGHTLAKALLNNAAEHIRNPVQIQAAIRDLNGPTPKANRARIALREAGLSAMPSLAAALADPARKNEYAAIRGAILSYRSAAIDPLMPLLLSDDPRLRAEAAIMLGRLGAEQAAPYLAAIAVSDEQADVEIDDARAARWALRKLGNDIPSRNAAVMYLDEKVTEALDDRHAPKFDYTEPRRAWQWNDAKRELSLREISYEQDRRETASRLAEALARVQPDHGWNQRRRLLARLAFEQSVAGDRIALKPETSTGVKLATELGVDVVEKTLSEAIQIDNVPAIIACCRILGGSGRPELLTRCQPQASPLVDAMRYVDRRVRRVATDAALTLNPTEPFPGDSQVIANLEHFLATSGMPRVLIGHGSRVEAARLAGIWKEMGYAADFASSGKRLFELAVASPDYQMILISDTIDRWNSLETAQWLRRDRRTFDIPIGIMKRPEQFTDEFPIARRSVYESRYSPAPPPPANYTGRSGFMRSDNDPIPDLKLNLERKLVPIPYPNHWAEATAETVPLVAVVPTPLSRDGADFVTRGVQDLVGGAFYSNDRTIDDAAWAATWTAKLCDLRANSEHFDLHCLEKPLITALQVPELSLLVAKPLGHLGTPAAQTALIDFASLPTVDIAARQAASVAFADAIKGHGTLLTKRQLLDQYERYNAGIANLDESAETNRILADILDAIESRGNQDSLNLLRD